MKSLITPVLLTLLMSLESCRPDQAEVSIEMLVQPPVVTTLADGSRQADLTMVITQIGNFYYQDFSYDFKKFQGTVIFDSLATTLPTAREFIQRRVIVPEPGLYYLSMRLGTETNGASTGKTVEIP
ncbi:MAG: hypothetical protein JNN28_21740 [Saprospiraceae bacterium]|nr:hypothetical protein [Saprospiraceae bacterium]